MRRMATSDTFADIAALLNPMPEQTPQNEDAYSDMAEETFREREDLAVALRAAWDNDGADPLLSTLERLQEQLLQVETDMRLLIAYGRRFTHPQPYKLIDLARASGKSISGARIAYDDDEIAQATEILHRPPTTADGTR